MRQARRLLCKRSRPLERILVAIISQLAVAAPATLAYATTVTAQVSTNSSRAVAVGAEGSDGQLWAEAPQLGSGWHALGGKIIAAPAVAAIPNPDGTTPT